MTKKIKYYLLLICVAVFCSVYLTTNFSYASTTDNAQINGYVEEIFIPIAGTTPNQPIRDYTFDKNQTSYDIVLSDVRTGGMVLNVEKKIIDEADTLSTYLAYETRLDDTIIEKPKRITKTTTNNIGTLTGLASGRIPAGTEHTFSIIVGIYDVNEETFIRADTYSYNVTKFLSLSELIATDENGVEVKINNIGFQKDPYVRNIAMVSQSDDINLALKAATSGAEIYVGKHLYTAGMTVNVADYCKEGSRVAKIPICLQYGELKTEYNLVVSKENYTPVITKQPESKTVDKGADDPLTVTVERPMTGELSYQWFRDYDTKPISGATGSSYQPDTKYARAEHYRCKVTNTVDGVDYTVYSDMVEYSVNLTYLTAPEILYQPVVPKKVNNASKVFYLGDVPVIEIGILQSQFGEAGIPYEVSVYKNDADSNEDGTDITRECAITQTKETGKALIYDIELPIEEKAGRVYYYVEVSVSKEGYDSSTEVSNTIGITYKDASEVVKELEGAGTESDPFLIQSLSDLQYVKDMVEGKRGVPFSFTGMTLLLTEDIKLPGDWEPIGCLKEGTTDPASGVNMIPFSGIIDGGGHTITVADGGKPLLNYVRKATVKNLDIYGTHINGYGLVDSYVVDYGADGHYVNNPILLRTINIENVTIKSGSKILRSGLIGGYASGANAVNIKNCVVEKDVIIGDDGSYGDLGDTTFMYNYIGYFTHRDNIGSLAGAFNGTITNCTSAATVYGRQNVGGLVGMKGQSMGKCDVLNSTFTGEIIATGDCVGGIAGAGYISGSAPGSPMVQIQNCYVDADITGHDKVGGLVGSEEGHFNNNETGDEYGIRGVLTMSDSFFYGTIHSSGSYVGGIAGCFHDFTKKSGEATNYYREGCGASKGIGGVLEGEIIGGEKHSISKTEDEFANGTVCSLLNESPTSLQNWEQGDKYPVIGNKAIITGLEVAGEYKNEYYLGDELDLSGMSVTAEWSDGNKTSVLLEDLEITGFDSSVRGLQEITLSFGPVSTTINVTVLKRPDPEKTEIEVSFELLGDMIHNSDEDGDVHCLSLNNLEPWIEATTYTVDVNATVKDVFELALEEYGMEWRNPTGNYVEAIFKDGEELAEFTNGVNSGWMYTLNGTHPNLGVSEQYLEDGDVIVWHYTDDYLQEEWHFQHEIEKVEKKAATCTEEGNQEYYRCKGCNLYFADENGNEEIKSNSWIIPALGGAHEPVLVGEKAATIKAEGYTGDLVCAKCGAVLEKGTVIEKLQEENPGPETPERKTNKITASNLVKEYNTVKKTYSIGAKALGGAKLTYTSGNSKIKVSSSGVITVPAKFVGKATITIKAAENDSYKAASKSITITVNPKTVKLVSVKNTASKKMTVKWKKNSAVTGYQIQYSTNKNFKSGNKKVTVSKKSTVAKTIKSLKKGKTYYVRIRTYKTVNGAKYYSKWSTKKAVKIAK